MRQFYLNPNVYINTIKTNWKYLILLAFIYVAFAITVLKPFKNLHLVNAVITTPSNAISNDFIKKVNNGSFIGGKLLSNIHFTPSSKANQYTLQFKTEFDQSLRSFFLSEVNNETGLHLAANEIRINLLADSLLKLQERFENLDSINNSDVPSQNRADIVKDVLNLQDQKIARTLAYLDGYLHKPIESFALIPEGFAISKVIEDQITNFNTLQYKRQLLLSREHLDKGALDEVLEAIKDARQHLSHTIADTRSDLEVEKKDTLLPATKNTSNVNADSAIQLLSLKITSLKNNIAAAETYNIALAKPSYYNYYKETIETSKAFSWIYLLIPAFGLILPFLISAPKKISPKASPRITPKGLIANFRFPSLILPKDDALREQAIKTFLQDQKKILLSVPLKDRFAKVILVTSSTNQFNTANFDLKFARELVSDNKKLLMIDCNVDEPSLLESLDVSYKYGLKGYLNEEISCSDVSVTTPGKFPGISFIGAGPNAQHQEDDLLNFINYLEEDLKNEKINQVSSDDFDKRISRIVKHYRLNFDFILLAIPGLDLLTRSSELYKLSNLRIYLLDDKKRGIITTEL